MTLRFLLLSSFILSLITTSSCKIATPTFKSIGQWGVTKVSGSEVIITNVATFNNPNKLHGLNVSKLALEVRTNGRRVGFVNTDDAKIKVPQNADFSVPLTFKINPVDLLGNVNSVLDMALGKSIDLQLYGDVSVGYSIVSKKIHIDQTVPVSISNLK